MRAAALRCFQICFHVCVRARAVVTLVRHAAGYMHQLLSDGRIAEAARVGPGTLRVLREKFLPPDSPDRAGFATALISHAVIVRELDVDEAVLHGRRLTYAEAAALPEADCAVMLAMLAEAFGVPAADAGRITSSDALVLALERHGAFREQEPAQGILGFVRSLFDGSESLGARVHHAVGGADIVDVVTAVSESVEETLRDLRRDLNDLEQRPEFFVLRDLPASTVRVLMHEGPQEIEPLVAACVMNDDSLVGLASEAVASAPYLCGPQREDLARGFAGVERGDVYACRHLLAGLEGALWLTARQEGVINAERHLVNSKRPPGLHAKGVNALLRPDGGLEVGTGLSILLLAGVFNDTGNDIRHGRAESGHESHTLWAYIGVLGWLDRFAGTALMRRVRERLHDELRQSRAG